MPDDALTRLGASLEAAREALREALRLRSGDSNTGDQIFGEIRKRMAYDMALARQQERFAKADSFRNAEIFSDLALEILLDLYIHESRAEQMAVRTALVNSSGSEATVRRWLKVLEKEGLISLPQGRDGDVISRVRLTEDGFESMTSYLCNISAIGSQVR